MQPSQYPNNPNPQMHPRDGRTDFYQAPKSKSAMAITGLVLGIIALLTSFLPIINNLSALLGILGLIFATVGLVGVARGKKSGKGLAIATLIVTILALVITFATQSMYSAAIDEASESINTATDMPATSEDGNSNYTIANEAANDSSQYYYAIDGTFTNSSDKDYNYVSITYNLYDADGAQIGNAYANTSNLKAGSDWKFEATSTVAPDEVASFERGEVSAW